MNLFNPTLVAWIVAECKDALLPLWCDVTLLGSHLYECVEIRQRIVNGVSSLDALYTTLHSVGEDADDTQYICTSLTQCIYNLDALVEVAAEEGYIAPEWKERILAFRNNPSDESWIK